MTAPLDPFFVLLPATTATFCSWVVGVQSTHVTRACVEFWDYMTITTLLIFQRVHGTIFATPMGFGVVT